MERVEGIEPSFQAWEAHVLPLNHTRVCSRTLVPAWAGTSNRSIALIQSRWLPGVYFPFDAGGAADREAVTAGWGFNNSARL